MDQCELKQIIEDLVQDAKGLESIINRLKQRQDDIQNNEFQARDLSSARTLSNQLRKTIGELEKRLIGG